MVRSSSTCNGPRRPGRPPRVRGAVVGRRAAAGAVPAVQVGLLLYVVLLLGVVVAAVLCGAVLHSWRMSSPPSFLGSMPSAIEEDCCDYCGFSHGGVRDGDPVLAPAEAVAREGRPERPGHGANYHELL